jgi:hypothetical protein
MYTIGKHLTSWQRNNISADLDEVLMGSEAFFAIAKELKRREQSVL